MSILFVIYSACIYFRLRVNAEGVHKQPLRVETVQILFHRFCAWCIKYMPILCLLWLGMLLLKLQLLIVAELEARGNIVQSGATIWIGSVCGSTVIVTLLYTLHSKWILRLQSKTFESNSNMVFSSAAFEHFSKAVTSNDSKKYDFGEKVAREVMTPRMDMICLEFRKPFAINVKTAIGYMRTRYPVVNLDKDDIIGFVHIKDLLSKYDLKESEYQWQQLIRPIITVPESIPISSLLTLMQKKKTQIALLIDEYGGTSGMATLEDILEEIVGDIQDEFDKEEHDIIRVQHDHYHLSAMLLIEEVNSYFNISLEVDDMDSIGGFMYANIQFPPHIGQCVVYEEEDMKYLFTIEQMDQLRITTIGIKRIQSRHIQDDELH